MFDRQRFASVARTMGAMAAVAGAVALFHGDVRAQNRYYTPSDAPPLPDSVIARWAQAARSSTLQFVHESTRLRPAGIDSRRPCRRRVVWKVGSGALKGEDARRFVELMDPATHVENRPLGGSASCRQDSSSYETIEVVAENADSIRYEVSFETGLATIMSAHEGSRYFRLGARAKPMFELVKKALSPDPLLDGLGICEVGGTDSSSLRDLGFIYVERLPEAVDRVAPEYPEVARRAGQSGTVVVQALIGVGGEVKETMITQSVRGLDEAAVRAVEQWDFQPAMSGSRPIQVWVAIPVRFSLH